MSAAAKPSDPKVPDYSWLALLLAGYLVFALTVTWLGIFLGISITPFHLPLLSLAFVALALLLRRDKTELFWVAILILASFLIALVFIDRSWDSLMYHKRAVIALADGWNPVYETLGI